MVTKRNFLKGRCWCVILLSAVYNFNVEQFYIEFTFFYNRVKNLQGMNTLKIYDPDPDKSFTKAKLARLNEEFRGNGENTSATANHFENFPTSDSAFADDFTALPKFVPLDTLAHLQNCGKNTRKSTDGVSEFASSKGLRLLSFVHDLQICVSPNSEDVVYLRALCWASYRKSVKYKVKMVIQRNGKPKILSAECDKICPAGKSGCCCHVMAVIWKLDEISRKDGVQPAGKRSCTSKPRKWGISGKRTVQHNPIMTQKLFKPRLSLDIKGRKRRGVYPTLFDPRPSKSRKIDLESVGKLKKNLQKLNPDVPLSKMIPDVDDIKLVDTIVGEVAYGSALHVQLKEFGTVVQEKESCTSSNSLPSISSCEVQVSEIVKGREETQRNEDNGFRIISPVKENPVSLHEIHQRCERIKKGLFKTEDEIADIEYQTRRQSACQEWYNHRFGRVTASKSYRVGCSHKVGTSPTKIIKEVLNYGSNYQSSAMRDGLKNEQLVIDGYIEMMHQQGHEQVTVMQCGFFIEKENGVLGASPDGVITDPSRNDPHGIFEAKNIVVNNGESLEDALVRKTICKRTDSGVLQVNKNHMYFYQVQQQMYVVKRLWSVLAIRGSNGKLFCMEISFEPEWWKEKQKNIEDFYDKYIIYELAYPRIRDGLCRCGFH